MPLGARKMPEVAHKTSGGSQTMPAEAQMWISSPMADKEIVERQVRTLDVPDSLDPRRHHHELAPTECRDRQADMGFQHAQPGVDIRRTVGSAQAKDAASNDSAPHLDVASIQRLILTAQTLFLT